ncbi:MAG: class I SAM-dependent methyltransferase [Dermatophilaceae bacterium]
MTEIEGTKTFRASADEYDSFMGRYSRPLASSFADYCVPPEATSFLDVGCGPGALTERVVTLLGPDAVSAVDPTPGFVAACKERNPGVDVRPAPAEELPFDTSRFDAAAAQLVFHFVSDPAARRRPDAPGRSPRGKGFGRGVGLRRGHGDVAGLLGCRALA